MKILVLNGPNLQLLGLRKPEVYGATTLEGIEGRLKELARSLGVELEFLQSNHEGALVDAIGSSLGRGFDGIVINPAAYTHTSVAIRDALESVKLPAIEVHISNVHAREEFRHKSLSAPVCLGQIAGLGADGYEMAVRALALHIARRNQQGKKQD
jgi:3-dehydroquinate dehydratase II